MASFIVDKNVLKKPFNSKEEEEQEKNLPFKKKENQRLTGRLTLRFFRALWLIHLIALV